MRLVTDMIEWCSERMPRWHPISISGYHIREAGSTAQQELAFTLKDGFTYVEQAIERGLDVDEFAPRLSFFFNAHLDFFEEIAKYRAARRIWARELRDTYGATSPEAMRMRFHTQTAGVSLTAQQPLVNIVRTTVEALAGVLGGTQSLHTNSYDEALALPTEEAVRIALRTQQVIAHETGVTNTIDPLGGAYFVEKLTDEMEAAAREYFARIDELGGMVAAVKNGFPQREIADAAFRYQHEVDQRKRIVVGVNDYKVDDEEQIPTLKIDPAMERKQAGRLGGDQGRPRRGRGRGGAGRDPQARRSRRREPDGALPRGRPGARLGGRDGRRAPGGLRHLHRAARLLGRFSGLPRPGIHRRMADLKVVKSDVDGWDVVRADEGVALTNHPTREQAEEAAHMRAQEDSISEESEGEVFVRPDEHHGSRRRAPGHEDGVLLARRAAGRRGGAGDRDRRDRGADRLRFLRPALALGFPRR